MIEVNLLPGATRKTARRRRPALALPDFRGALGKFDRLMAFAIVAWPLGLVLVGFMFVSTQREKSELALNLEKATQDSAHFATIIKTNEHLTTRRDSIAQRLKLIQDIDANRYVWSHILDEIDRTLPAYTWLMTVVEVVDTAAATPRFQIDGRTGNTFALTEFMKDLEASPFIHGVKLLTTSIVREDDREVHAFSLEAQYEVPPADAVQTVPLFKPEE